MTIYKNRSWQGWCRWNYVGLVSFPDICTSMCTQCHKCHLQTSQAKFCTYVEIHTIFGTVYQNNYGFCARYILLYLQTSQAQFFLCRDPDYFWDDVLILEAVAAAFFKHIFATKKLELSIQSFCSGMESQQKAKQKTSPQSLREKMCPTSRNIFFSDTI